MSTEPDSEHLLDAHDLRDLCCIAASICFGITTIISTLRGTLPAWLNWLDLAAAVAFLIAATPGVFRKR